MGGSIPWGGTIHQVSEGGGGQGVGHAWVAVLLRGNETILRRTAASPTENETILRRTAASPTETQNLTPRAEMREMQDKRIPRAHTHNIHS